MSRKLKVAIAGLGRSGWNIHAMALKKMPEQFEIVAAADQLPERRRDAKELFGARVYRDYLPMIKQGGFDLLVNALPSPLHVKGSLQGLNAGSAVVCEKPLARNVKEVDRLAAAAKKNKVMLAPFQQNRLQPYLFKIKEVINSGVLGELLHIRLSCSSFSRRWDWQTLQKNMGGSLFNTGPHAVDQVIYLIGEKKKPKVFCCMKSNHLFAGDAEDFCALSLYGKKMPLVEILISAYQAYAQGDRYSISGTCGGLAGGEKELRWRYFDPKKAPTHKMWNWSVDRKYVSEELPWQEKEWNLGDADLANATGYTFVSLPSGVNAFYINIYDVLENRGKLLITIPQVRRQIEIIEEAHRQNPLPRK